LKKRMSLRHGSSSRPPFQDPEFKLQYCKMKKKKNYSLINLSLKDNRVIEYEMEL
jgi:hypothetical protein